MTLRLAVCPTMVPGHPRDPLPVEQVGQQRAQRLRGIAAPPAGLDHGVADLRATPAGTQVAADLADHRAVAAPDDEQRPEALDLARPRAGEQVHDLERERRRVAGREGDALGRAALEQGARHPAADRPQHEPLRGYLDHARRIPPGA
jgi:hypothetical protein